MTDYINSRYANLELIKNGKVLKNATLDINDKWSFDIKKDFGVALFCTIKVFGWSFNRMWDIKTNSVSFLNCGVLEGKVNKGIYKVKINAGYTNNYSRGITFSGTVWDSEIYYGDTPEDTYIEMKLLSCSDGLEERKSISFNYQNDNGTLFDCLKQIKETFKYNLIIGNKMQDFELTSFSCSGNIIDILSSLNSTFLGGSFVLYFYNQTIFVKDVINDGDFVYNKNKKVHTIMGTSGMIGTPCFDNLYLKLSNRLRSFEYGEKYPVISYFVPFLTPRKKDGSDIRIFSVYNIRYIGETRGNIWRTELEMVSQNTALTLNKFNSIIKISGTI